MKSSFRSISPPHPHAKHPHHRRPRQPAGAHPRTPSVLARLLRPGAAPAPGAGPQTAPRLHSLQRVAPPVLPPRPGGPSRLADPLHVPVCLVRPGSRAVFSSVILVSLLMDDRMGKRKRLTVTTISGHQRRIRAPITYGAGSSCSTNVEMKFVRATAPAALQKSNLKQCTEFLVDTLSVVCIKLAKFCDNQILQNSSYFVQSDH